jgi:uncharacterized protein
MAGTFELTKDAGGEFIFNLKAGNGQVLLTSESYKAKASATNGIESVRTNATDDARYDRRTSSNGKPYFVLTATNGQVIGRGQMYSSPDAMENGIRSIRENAPGATVDDQS